MGNTAFRIAKMLIQLYEKLTTVFRCDLPIIFTIRLRRSSNSGGNSYGGILQVSCQWSF